MFTTKYRTTDGAEYLDGPFERVTKVTDPTGTIVTGHLADGGASQFGPVQARSIGDIDPKVWVMNEQGATVATYDL